MLIKLFNQVKAGISLHITSLLDPSIKIHLDRKIYEHGMKESSIIYLSEQDKVISGYIFPVVGVITDHYQPLPATTSEYSVQPTTYSLLEV